MKLFGKQVNVLDVEHPEHADIVKGKYCGVIERLGKVPSSDGECDSQITVHENGKLAAVRKQGASVDEIIVYDYDGRVTAVLIDPRIGSKEDPKEPFITLIIDDNGYQLFVSGETTAEKVLSVIKAIENNTIIKNVKSIVSPGLGGETR
ncbi:MAG: hypothetical protein GY804_04890 [Alphaproteobacteria bacterium]|nr:hypothetical protein [Alphaproteobacteria bacterium]